MKALIKHDIGNYSFNALNKTVSFFGVTIAKEQILTITNSTANKLIYVFADESLGGVYDGLSQTLILTTDTSSMNDLDDLQIYIDIPETIQSKILDVLEVLAEQEKEEKGDCGECLTQDINMANVLGSQSLVDNNRLSTKTVFNDIIYSGRIGALGEEYTVDCKGYSTVAVQISGTFTGTIAFEGRTDFGNYVSLLGTPSGSDVAGTSATAAGLWRINTAGIVAFRIRFSAFTAGSGTALFAISTSAEPGPVIFNNSVVGSQGQKIAQRATTFEASTWDNNLATVLGAVQLWRTGFTATEQIVAPTINPTQPTSYAGSMYARFPQIFPRLRVESGGSERLPFNQEMGTNNIVVTVPGMISLLERIEEQIRFLNQLTMDVNKLSYPNGWQEVR